MNHEVIVFALRELVKAMFEETCPDRCYEGEFEVEIQDLAKALNNKEGGK